MELPMSLSKNIAAVAASIVSALLIAPASAQTMDKAAAAAGASKAVSNLAAPTSGAMPQSGAPATVRPISKMQAAGGESGSGKAPTSANDPK
jgi:hypothetical protein